MNAKENGHDGEQLVVGAEDDVVPRGVAIPLTAAHLSSPPPAAYGHQLYTLGRLESGADATPPVSGIVHLPTGAGKTRIGLELMARTLQREPSHRFIWATESRLLIQQTMMRTLEFAHSFPAGTRIAWYDGFQLLLEDPNIHIIFITRTQLREALSRAHYARGPHPWRTRAENGLPTTLFYDECHQLGAEKLQKELKKFHQKVLKSPEARRHKWRIIGLSATPIPTRQEAHALLKECVFPLRSEFPNVGRDWGMHVFHRVANAELIRERILCEVNMHMDRSGIFDIPPDLIKRVVRDKHVVPPGVGASRDEVTQYAMAFNRDVMGHEAVLQFLADRLARNLSQLGKTIVFVPTIHAANLLVTKLNGNPSMLGKVALVHSRMDGGARVGQNQGGRTPEQVLAQFKARGSEACILVNVEMLTEGFDDPKVRTVVLAKLTLSTNRFWQMIGRGTRGPLARGTPDCFVIDPIKLVRVYDYFGGYQPSVGSTAGDAIEDEGEEKGADALDPSVPAISRAPLPSTTHYEVSSELRAIHAAVAEAIDAFLQGGRLGEEQAVEIARSAQIVSIDGGVVVQPGGGEQTIGTGSVLLHETLQRISVCLNADLGWLERQLPSVANDELLRYWIRKLSAIEQLGIRTEEEYGRAEMAGRIAVLLGTSVVPSGELPPGSVPVRSVALTDTTLDAVVLCRAVAHSDGELVAAEVEVAARVVNRITAAIDDSELRARISSGSPSADERTAATARLRATLDRDHCKKLLKGLAEVAAADGRFHPDEIIIMSDIAVELGMSRDYAEGVLDSAG